MGVHTNDGGDRWPRRWTGRAGADHEARPVGTGLDDLIMRVARGDREAFEELYREIAGPVYGLVLRVLRDPQQAEEVAQEVLLEVWRTAARFDPSRAGAMAWVMTLAHRRAVDRVRSAQAARRREERALPPDPPFDQVTEQVQTRLETEQVRRCLTTLTDLQRQAITLAYYGGRTHREVATVLDVPIGTIKTRMRDGLIRMRDCLGVRR
ncbi:ECF RNA polymerase sigma factor SigK [Thermomonospora umbrina]|uniref:RNA polymerase sigma-70 factor (ECF subfamily) n=1 Tax=Thermomonospora umbrina TaxID=111806 RepID=A0A3D9SKW9_9ACTN|nr:ECF RNA polymerase sigma factor SigK [Thermomonospora umbrina]REE95050.1 RNA polymerase sigma-70 factor (ECF subfamily) [Thermomonospora umbrina]